MSSSPQIFEIANQAIIDDIKTELRLQGHYFTGALEASLTPQEIEEGNFIILTASANAYLKDLENGIPASQINLSSINYTSLANWVQVKSIWRGCSAKKALSIAFAIAKKWKKEGFELYGAIYFSKTGSVDHAIQQTFSKNDEKYFDLVDNVAIGNLDLQFNNTKTGTI